MILNQSFPPLNLFNLTQHILQITDKEGMSYVSVVLETLKRLKSVMPPLSDPQVDSLSLAPSPALGPPAPPAQDTEQRLHRDNIKVISEEQESLTRSKAAIENKIKELESKKAEEEEAIKRREMVTKLVNDVEEGKSIYIDYSSCMTTDKGVFYERFSIFSPQMHF